jgi:TPR repeat protein
MEQYKEILKCDSCEKDIILDLDKIHIGNLFSLNNPVKPDSGWSSGTEVIIIPENCKNLIAIKNFKNIEEGLKELFYSLIALEINPAPHEIKMARIYDTVICPQNSLSIIMEAVNRTNIHHLLSTDLAIDAVRACAEYLGIFHIENHHKLNKSADGKKHLRHVSHSFHTLTQDTLEEQNKEFKLLSLRPKEYISESQVIRSDMIVYLLQKNEQEIFEKLVKISSSSLKENTENIFRSLLENTLQQEPYFLTITHGDAHAHNFFYDDSELELNSANIPKDSYQRVSMIDFASIIKTYGNIGDPAEDVGRFLAALRNWWAIENQDDQKVINLQNEFINRYFETIKNSGIIEEVNQEHFKKRFRENISFYKLRYYRTIFNVKKDNDLKKDEEIKRKLLKSWIEENAHPESLTEENPKKIIEQEKERFWKSVDDKNIFHWLPDRSNEFIEATAEGEDNSYLTSLWKRLENTSNVTLSSTAAIAGMGGIGKTSLALEFAHEALKNKAYNLIYWIHSGNEPSLIKAYKEILLKIIDPTLCDSVKYGNDNHIINLIREHVPKWGKCLLIYDNVPDSEFLKDKTPENTHILMTSRCNQGWERQPLILSVFSTEDSIRYLLKITGIEKANASNDMIKTLKQLAEELDHFPLALAHAAHYIKLVGGNNVLEKHFQDYLKAFRKEGLENFEENRNFLTEAQSKVTHENLIAKTFHISMQYVSQIAANPFLVEKIMGFCAYLNPDVIMEEIFLKHYEKDSRKVLNLLYDLSFLKKLKDDATFSIHRLVQLVIRDNKETKSNPQYEEIFKDIAPVLSEFFESNTETEEQINKLLNNLQHIIHLLENSIRLGISSSLERLQWIGWLIESIESVTLYNQYQVCIENLRSNPQFFHKRIMESSSIDPLTSEKTQEALKLFPSLISDSISSNDIAENREDMESILRKLMGISGVPSNRSKYLAKSFIQERLLFDHLTRHNNVPQYIIQIVEKGHSSLKAALGNHYWRDTDMKNAFKWFSIAADEGNTEAQYYLAVTYHEGKVTQKNIREAIYWYIEAAEKGHPNAQYNLGTIYANEKEVLDYNLSIQYLTLAAKQEHSQAQLKLGKMYVKRNLEKAIFWLEKATKNGNTKASDLLELLYKAKEEFYNFIIDAEEGNIEAQYQLGAAYEEGIRIPKDITEAIRWYDIAAKKGHAKALIELQKISQKIVNVFGIAGIIHAKECFEKGDEDLGEYFMKEARKILSSSENDIQLNSIMQNSNESISQKQHLSNSTAELDIIKESGIQLSSLSLAKKPQLKNESMALLTRENFLNHLNLFNTNPTDQSVKVLVENLPALRGLEIDGNNLTHQGIKHLLDQMRELKNLNLNLSSSDRSYEVIEALKSGLSLTSLNLSHNRIDDHLLGELLKAIKGKELSSLSLKANQLTAEAGHMIGEYLQEDDSLTFLDLTNNNISNEGTKSILNALGINQTLQVLKLSMNKIEAEGIIGLPEMLKVNLTLAELSLTNNECSLSTQGLEFLKKAQQVRRVFKLDY